MPVLLMVAAVIVLPCPACRVPELVKLLDTLTSVVFASSVPEFVNAPPMASVVSAFDWNVPLLSRLASVVSSVRPKTVPACVLNVALAPVIFNAFPACTTPVLTLLIASAALPALMFRSLSARSLPVFASTVFTFN